MNKHSIEDENAALVAKYAITGRLYDILDFPWELQYRAWRPVLQAGIRGRVLEAGVGTGRNLPYYHPGVDLLAIDLSPTMLSRARRRVRSAACRVELRQEDATRLGSVADATFDWVLSTFMYCVMPDALQPAALDQMRRVLTPGGRFRLVEMVYSKRPNLRRRQERFAPFVEKVYGARFDRNTLAHVERCSGLEVTGTRYLKADTYLLIEGRRAPLSSDDR